MTEEEMQREALAMLKSQMSEGRNVARRHQRFALFVVLPVVVIGLLILVKVFGPRWAKLPSSLFQREEGQGMEGSTPSSLVAELLDRSHPTLKQHDFLIVKQIERRNSQNEDALLS